MTFDHSTTRTIRPPIGLHSMEGFSSRVLGFPLSGVLVMVVGIFSELLTRVNAAVDERLIQPKRNLSSTDHRYRPTETVCERVERAVRANRSATPEIVTRELAGTVRNPIIYSGQVVQAALCGLGPEISADEGARLVFAAVKARPAAVLEVVRVAVSGTRRSLHRAIVSAAVAGVPDPTARVLFQPVKVVRTGLEADPDCHCQPGQGYNTNTDTGNRGQSSGANPVGYVSSSGQGYSLAESILEAALQAGTNENQADLSAGIDSVLESRRNELGDLVLGSASGAGQGADAFGTGSTGGQSLDSTLGAFGSSFFLGTPPTFGGPTPGPTPPSVSP